MNKKIEKVLKLVNDDALKNAIVSLMDKHYDAFVSQPGGCSRHHAYKGGLLDHSCNTAITAHGIAMNYTNIYTPRLNVDLIVTGAFLHDIGKVKCYVFDKEKDVFRSTNKSRLHHHIPIGFHLVATEVERQVEAGNMEEKLADHLLHMIVSHHGRVEYRSPQPPKTREAFIVSQADLIDAYMAAPDWARKSFNKEAK